jgi:hypothetical protein
MIIFVTNWLKPVVTGAMGEVRAADRAAAAEVQGEKRRARQQAIWQRRKGGRLLSSPGEELKIHGREKNCLIIYS